MRRLSLALVVFTALLSGWVCAADNAPQPKKQTESFQYLEKWVGESPMAVPEGNTWGMKPHGNIWDDPKLAENLKKTLGETRNKILFEGWDNARIYEFERTGNYIHFLLCAKGACNKFGTTVFISLIDGSVQACWVDPANMFGGSPSFWLTSKGEKKLPDGSCVAEAPEELLKKFAEKKD